MVGHGLRYSDFAGFIGISVGVIGKEMGSTGSSSHFRTKLPKSSSRPLPA